MKAPIIIIGIGEMAGVFARGLLRSGHPLYPITRDMDMAAEAQALPEPQAVLVAVAEKDLYATLQQLPQTWRERLILLQNELLPRDWLMHDIHSPTVISVWFEKKTGPRLQGLDPLTGLRPQRDATQQCLGIDGYPGQGVGLSGSTGVRTGTQECLYPYHQYRRPGNRWQRTRAVAATPRLRAHRGQ